MPRSRLVTTAFWTVCGVFAVITGFRAAMRPFWYDELYTLYIAQMGSPAKIWAALLQHVDLNPPLFYVLTHAGQLAAPGIEFGTRLPAIAGFLMLMACLYASVARRMPVAYAFLAMLIPIVSNTYLFATEARPYGVMLGCAALSFYCWQGAASRETARGWQLGGLAAAILTALLSHCFAVMMMPALGIGELVRTVKRRKIDWAVWLAILAPCIAVVTYIPLLRSTSKGHVGGPILEPTGWKLAQAYWNLLGPAIVPVGIGLLVVAYGVSLNGSDLKRRWRELREAWPVHELAAAATYVAVPLVAFVTATVLHSGFFPRYGSIGAVGFSLAAAWAVFLFAGADLRRASLAPALLFAWFVGSFAIQSTKAPTPFLPAELKDWAHSDAPLVVADGQTFLFLDHYLDAQAASRLVFLTDFDSAMRIMQTDCYDSALRLVKPHFPIRGRLMDYREFLEGNRRFLVYGSAGPEHQWVLTKFREEHFIMARLSADREILAVSTP